MMNQHVRDQMISLLTVPVVKMRAGVLQVIPNGTETVVALDTTDIDTDTMADLVNDRISIVTPGRVHHRGNRLMGGRRDLVPDAAPQAHSIGSSQVHR